MTLQPNIDRGLLGVLRQSPDKFYHEFFQAKTKFGSPQINKDGTEKMRHITSPNYLLKKMQREINNHLQEFELPDCMYGGVPEKNNVVNALQHIGNRFFLTIDLKNFFGNITNSRVHQTLISLGFTWELARDITRIATRRGALPQGVPTSTTLANLAFAQTASILESFCKEKDITFTLFVDDLTFSSTKCFKYIIPQILDIIKNGEFFVNHKKIHYKKNCCEITGLYVKRGKLSLPKGMLINIDKPGIKQYVSTVTKQYNSHIAQSTPILADVVTNK